MRDEELTALFEEGRAGRPAISAAKSTAQSVLRTLRPRLQVTPGVVRAVPTPKSRILTTVRETDPHRIKVPKLEVRKQMFGVL